MAGYFFVRNRFFAEEPALRHLAFFLVDGLVYLMLSWIGGDWSSFTSF
jgi:hypothetical protein